MEYKNFLKPGQILKHTHKDPYIITNFDSLTL